MHWVLSLLGHVNLGAFEYFVYGDPWNLSMASVFMLLLAMQALERKVDLRPLQLHITVSALLE